MPRYFFNIEGVEHLPRDAAGDELPNDDAACRRAGFQVREIRSEASKADWDMTDWRMVVTSGDGRKVAEVPIEAGTPRQLKKLPRLDLP